MKRAVVSIDPELLCELLHFPKGTTIDPVASDSSTIDIVVTHEDLRDVEGFGVAQPLYTKSDDGAVVFQGWGQE